MSKVKLIYEKREFDVERISGRPLDYSYRTITDMAIPTTLYTHEIELVKHKKLWKDEIMLVLKSKDKKKFLRCKIMCILENNFSGKVNIISLK